MASWRTIIGSWFLAGVALCGPARSAGAAGPPDMTARYRVHDGEVLHDIARRFGLGFVELRAANPGIDPWLPGDGTVLRLPVQHLLPAAPHRGIVINLPELRLYYFPKSGGPPFTFPIGIGQEGDRTPLGVTRVMAKLTDPAWIVPVSIRAEDPGLPARVPPGPDNPLGRYALRLAWNGYLIHGTNKPDGVGRRVSHGCIRLYPEDIAILFKAVPVGTPVRVVNQPVKVGWIGDALFVEAHPTQHGDDLIEYGKKPEAFPPYLGDAIALIRHAAGKAVGRLDLKRVVAVLRARRGIPVQVMRRAARSGHDQVSGRQAATVPVFH